MPGQSVALHRGTAQSRTRQRWVLANAAETLLKGPAELEVDHESTTGASPKGRLLSYSGSSHSMPDLLSKLPAIGGRPPLAENRRTSLVARDSVQLVSEDLKDAFQEIDQLLKNRPDFRYLPAADTSAEGEMKVEPTPKRQSLVKASLASSPSEPQKKTPSKATKAVEEDVESDHEDEHAKKPKQLNVKESVASKIVARRLADNDVRVPMAKHKVEGLKGPERHLLVDVAAVQKRCERLGETVSVDQMLQRRRLKEEAEQEQKLRQARAERQTTLAIEQARLISELPEEMQFALLQENMLPETWEDRQEQVVLRRRQKHREKALQRVAATRKVRGLLRRSALDASFQRNEGAQGMVRSLSTVELIPAHLLPPDDSDEDY